ncbi:MAG TPA: ABC transporter substrate-binding protein [Oscillospiraceae bacterium]|nr:ABC transporter substrate-binding protein [Oscillospiraceae bacterium]HPS35428.1 ABC transporter substrate-binding protein [Oscillospiraceae bacterium]
MKKIFTALLSMLVCGALLLAGCGNPSAALPGELFGKNLDVPDALNLLVPSFFSNSQADTAGLKREWLDAMSVRYGVNINILTNEYKDGQRVSDVNSQMYSALYGKSAFAGLIYVSGYDTLVRAIQNGTAVALDDYLADNPAWKALPEDIRSMYLVDGHIYAVPASCYWDMYARSVYTDSLTQTGIQVTDLNSLREYALALKQAGTYDYAIGSAGTDGLGDILNAFGLYADGYSGHPFSYDPGEDSVVDFLTKDSSISALKYLRELYAVGALKLIPYNKTSNPYNNFISGESATNYDEYTIDEKYTEVLTLNPAYPQLLRCGMSGYIMTKDTPQPKETVNFFVSMLFGSEQNYLDCSLGLSDNYVLNSDGTITLKLEINEDGGVDNFATPGLVGTLPGAFPHSNQRYDLELIGNPTAELTASIEKSKQFLAAIDDAVKKGSALKVPVSYRQIHTSKFYDKKSDINYLFANCIKDAITAENWTVEEIVKQYRLDMLGLGGNAMLDEMNYAIGKKTAYYYG